MTMILIDGFDHDDFADVWTVVGGNFTSTTGPRTGTRNLVLGSNTQCYRALTVGAEEDDGVTMGAAFFQEPASGDFMSMWQTFQEDATYHINVGFWLASRSIRIYRGSYAAGVATLLAESDINLWTPNTWHYLETGVKIADSGGLVEVRLNGVTVLDYAGDTKNGGTGIINRMGIGSVFSGQLRLVDDVYMLNEQGSSPWNSFLGDTRCYPLYPNGNGFYSQLDGSDGNSTDNYLLVDEAGTPSSTDYVGSVTNGEIDTYAFQDISAVQSIGTIYAVESRIYAAKSETGTKQMRLVVRRSSTDATGPDHILAENSYATYRYIMQLDPHAGPGAWTISNVDASEFGAEIRP